MADLTFYLHDRIGTLVKILIILIRTQFRQQPGLRGDIGKEC